MSHIVDAVQVPGALLVEHVLTLAAYNFQGVRPIEELAGLSGIRNYILETIKRDTRNHKAKAKAAARPALRLQCKRQ